MIKRRSFITLLGGAAAAWPLAARAQQTIRRIGMLVPAAADDAEFQTRVGAFLEGLQQLGWTIGRNVQIDSRWATNDAVEIRRHAAELAALAPDAILASSSPALAALQQATRTVPIVFVNVIDPCSASRCRRGCSPAPTRSSNKLARLHQLCCTCSRPLLALFCRANRAEQCPLSGVDRPTYAQREFFAF